MVRLNILAGKKAGTTWVARHFPVRIGRSAEADLRLEEKGVWDQHIEIDLDQTEGFVLNAQGEAAARVNGRGVERAVLHNGDGIEVGSVKLQFWLGETRQGGLRLREWLTWMGIGALSLGQVGLIWWLMQ